MRPNVDLAKRVNFCPEPVSRFGATLGATKSPDWRRLPLSGNVCQKFTKGKRTLAI
jgi:hypothetical protein